MTGGTGLRRFVRPSADPGGHDRPQAAPGSAPDTAAPEAPAGADELRVSDKKGSGMVAPALPAPVAEVLAGRARDAGQQGEQEKCEMCAAEVPPEHSHVADLEGASLMCACRACYLLFTQRSAGGGRYRAVPDRYLADASRVISPAQWDLLQVPVGLAFFLHSSRAGGELTGFYPSPVGATECRLDLKLWQQLAADFPLLAAPEADVEAALISRSDAGVEYFVVPIDACYELVGRMRMNWKGFDGGTEARQSIEDFLTMVRSRARQWSGEG
ncbi:MAG TPA: DUF5947 family protein [Streptosporangiaceae bacterium]|nr:DUF5947 family protein [Streptosporangiaceae bacterium]